MKEVINAFPYYQIWSSFEVVLLLYFCFSDKYFDYNRALDSIQDLVSLIFKAKQSDLVNRRDLNLISNDEFSLKIQKVRENAQGYKNNYTKRIEIIRNLIAS